MKLRIADNTMNYNSRSVFPELANLLEVLNKHISKDKQQYKTTIRGMAGGRTVKNWCRTTPGKDLWVCAGFPGCRKGCPCSLLWETLENQP